MPCAPCITPAEVADTREQVPRYLKHKANNIEWQCYNNKNKHYADFNNFSCLHKLTDIKCLY